MFSYRFFVTPLSLINYWPMPYSALSGYGSHWRFEDRERSLRVTRGAAESSPTILSELLDYGTRIRRPGARLCYLCCNSIKWSEMSRCQSALPLNVMQCFKSLCCSTYLWRSKSRNNYVTTFIFSQISQPWWKWKCLSLCVLSKWWTNPFRRTREMVFFRKHRWVVVVDSYGCPVNDLCCYSWDRARVRPGALQCWRHRHVAHSQPWESQFALWWHRWDKSPVYV